MSGGTFNYMQYQIEDAINEIKHTLDMNNKTVQQNWDDSSEDEREYFSEYKRPWTLLKHDIWADEEAEIEADRQFGVEEVEVAGKYGKYKERFYHCKPFDKLTSKQRDEWNKIRMTELQKLIDEHNNSLVGPDYSDKTVSKIKEMLVTIKKAKIYLDRIDWLFAGDDGEETFLERTEEDLKKAGLE